MCLYLPLMEKQTTFQQFADRVVGILSTNDFVVGLAAGGSWIGGQLDEYSDIDFVMVTREGLEGMLAELREVVRMYRDLRSELYPGGGGIAQGE